MNPNDPAFCSENPTLAIRTDLQEKGLADKVIAISNSRTGLTKREYFAAMAMTAAMQYASGDGRYSMKAADFAKSAIAYADALIAELSK